MNAECADILSPGSFSLELDPSYAMTGTGSSSNAASTFRKQLSVVTSGRLSRRNNLGQNYERYGPHGKGPQRKGKPNERLFHPQKFLQRIEITGSMR